MDKRINPFNELYLTETIGSTEFVRLFSPYILKNAEALFLPGNIVLQGVQGSGKSMLLNLLKPEVRIAYAQANERFPVSGKLSRFIGAGINLTRSRSIDFGQRPIDPNHPDDHNVIPLYFGDFLNYWIVFDVLKSVELLGNSGRHHKLDVSPDASNDTLNVFATALANDDCWFGYLRDVHDYKSLKERLSSRITQYLAFLNFNSQFLDPAIAGSKTSVGSPVSRTAEHLRKTGVIEEDVELFVRIDQYEELTRLEGLYKNLGPLYRQVVNKAVGLRDPHVSYRIGTRRYAWNADGLQFFGTTGQLEEDRNYKTIDLDEILRRKENAKTWVFPDFAEDVFRKRLSFSGYNCEGRDALLRDVLGKGMSPEDKARGYAGKSPVRAVKIDDAWPPAWKEFLANLALTDPLSARLAEAWARQRSKGSITATVPVPPYPWSRSYWRKERLDQALMQIASRCGQRMIWSGRDEVLQLSGGNILVFVSLCQHIWGAWLRTVRDRLSDDAAISVIEESVQSVGIHEASTHWYQKITEDARGDTRQRFVRYVGALLEKQMFDDLPLSYPGNNGFSLSVDDIERDAVVTQLLNDSVAHGDLFDAPHTTKEKNRKPRRKWYLNPVLSPHFRLPHVRTKEPMYITLDEIRVWMREIGVDVGNGLANPRARTPKAETGDAGQASLFGEDGK